MAAEKTKKSSKILNKHLTHKDSPKSSNGKVIIPATPLRPAQLTGESQKGNTITLALRTPKWLHLGPDITPRVMLLSETKPT